MDIKNRISSNYPSSSSPVTPTTAPPPLQTIRTTNNNNLNNNNISSYSGIPTHIIEERQDVIFRKVRGILNKITPETFDKLSKELVNVGLDTPRTLRGVIYLLFDKALKDLKYSSLYAKLCQELSEKAPDFEQEPGPNTFCKFLISKCEDEFERRRKATEDFDSKNELTDEEYEQKAIAKQKMLGNIKFICELGKKRLLQEEILHECIRGLLSKKKERPIQDQAQDLECLCQIMRTIGSLLDIQASRNLMNQYFERIDLFSKKPELPSRIRFMLRDVIDLRNNNWRPRPFQREDNVPQTLSKLREEAGYDQSTSSSTDKFGNSRNLIGMSDLSKLHGNKLSMLFDDEPSFTTSTDFHWGPAFLPLDQHFDAFSSPSAIAAKHNTTTTVSTSDTSTSVPIFQKQTSFQHNDPFSEPGSGRFEKQPMNNSVAVVKQSGESKRIIPGSAFERKPFPDTITVNTCNDRDSSTSNMRNRAPPPPNVANPPRMQQREDLPFNTSRRFGDARQSQPPLAIRGGNTSPVMRSTIRRHAHEVVNQPPLPHPPVPQNYRFDSRNTHAEVPDNRERRFHRVDYPEHDYRHPRFSNNANYRQGRNDRLPNRGEQNYFEKSNQPESELNFNWRAGPSTSATTAPVNNTALSPSVSNVQRPIAPRPSDRLMESKMGGDKLVKPRDITPIKTAINQFGEANRKPEDSHNEKNSLIDRDCVPVRNERDFATPNFRGPLTNTANHPVMGQHQHQHHHHSQQPHQQQQRVIDQPVNSSRFTDARQSQVMRGASNTSPARYAPRRPQEINQPSHPPIHQNYRNNSRSMQPEITDKREPRKFYPPHSEDHEPQHSRYPDNGVFHHQERNFRAPVGRNQQIENPPVLESDRAPNWRRGNNVAPNNVVKEQPIQNLNPLLPKPPTKISDTNFSLRPSHNLIGRAGITGSTQSSKSNTKIDLSSNESAQTRESHEANDSMKSNINPVSRFQTETAASSLHHSSILLPPKVGNEVIAENENKIGSTNGSPTRNAARDFHVNKFISVISEFSNESSPNVNRVVTKVKELKVPKSYQHECLVSAMKQSILKSETDRDNISKLFIQLIPSIFEAPSLLNAFKVIFEQMHALEVEIPKVKSLVAEFLSRAILDGLLALEEVGNVLSRGKHHPLFLLCLQKLEKNAGQAWLNEKFIASKINLMDMLPEVDRTKNRLASILKDRCLGFLDPMLTIEPDLWAQMKERDPSPAGVYRWIKDNVDQIIQSTSTFAHVLISCLLRYIHNVAIEKSKTVISEQEEADAPQSNKSSPSSSSQSTSDIEKELLTKYQQVLQAILKEKKMQLATLYALQSFYHGLDFPKGSLLRWFHMLYDMNIVDDDVFFIWKEEINDEFPGKGQALFQVNTWLNWLAEAESEEEEDV